MRNYIRMQCLRIYTLPFDPAQFYVVFGGDEDSLIYYADRLKAQLNAQPPIKHFSIPEPSVIWFELNQDNFAKLCNLAAGTIWQQSRLNTEFQTDPSLETIYDMTRVEVEGSPRKTWSHGH